MKSVNTVLGPISTGELGITLMHEHVAAGNNDWRIDESRYPFNKDKALSVALSVAKDLRACDVSTFVDATPIDNGRNAALLEEVSRKSEINIVCSTGLYTEQNGGSFYFRYLSNFLDGVKEIYDLFTKEITHGIAGTSVKAGVMKIATGFGKISPYEEMVLKAAARAQESTGVPIITHTEAGTMGPEQADLLISEGARPTSIMIGHAGGCDSLDYHVDTLSRGVFIGFDRLGLDSKVWKAGPDHVRLTCISGLVALGYGDRILFGHDYVMNWLGRDGRSLLPKEEVKNWYPTHLFKNIIPELKKHGVTDEQIHAMLVENPRRLFEGSD